MKKKSEIVIDAFKAGDYPQGNFGAKELSELASSYDPKNYEAPILIGHLSDPSYKGKSSIPAYGWIGAVKVVGDHLKFVASQFSEQLKGFIKDGFYKKVSAAFFQPNDPNNPTPGKWHLHHLAFLGGVPPAVKGLEQIAFAQMVSGGMEFSEMVVEFAEDGAIEEVEEMGKEDTLKNMTEYCANFISKVEMALSADVDAETRKGRINLAAYDLQSELSSCVNEHFAFMNKMESVGEKKEDGKMEMSEKKGWLVRLAGRVHEVITQRKEVDMDATKEKEYQEKISTLEIQVKEFAEKERLAKEAIATAEKATKDAAEKAKSNALTAEVKTFCETAVKEGRMTPAMVETDNPIMLNLAKVDPSALKSFQEKYAKPIVPIGTVSEIDQHGADDKRPQILQSAEKYAVAHRADKEFAGLTAANAISRAVYLHSIGQIKFEAESTINQKGA